MTNDEIIKKLRDMSKYPTVTLPRDCEALKAAANLLAQRPWVGLTDKEIDKIYEAHHNQYGECESVNFGYERAIEAKLQEKNT